MSQETENNVEQPAQTTEADSNVDYKALYHQEVKNSKSQRSKKQELEAKMENLELKSEDDRQAKMIAEGKKDELLQTYKDKFKGKEGGADQYNDLLKKANDKFKKTLEKHVKTFSGKGNKVSINDVFGSSLPETIKALGARLTAIDKEEKEDLVAKTNERYEIAKTDMTREQHIKLLEIIKKHGVSLKEGAMGVKMYYEIAKEAYLEGLSNGLKI